MFGLSSSVHPTLRTSLDFLKYEVLRLRLFLSVLMSRQFAVKFSKGTVQ